RLLRLFRKQLRHLTQLDVLAFSVAKRVDEDTTLVSDIASERAVDDMLKRLERFTAMTREQFGLLTLEVQSRTVGSLFARNLRIDAERTGHSLEKFNDGLRRIAHLSPSARPQLRSCRRRHVSAAVPQPDERF